MKIIVHGAAQEVGRSCIEVDSAGKRFIFDAGIKFGEEGTEYPIELKDFEDIQAVFVSHAHLDHTGFLPYLVKGGIECPIFMTRATQTLSRILLKDSYEIDLMKHQLSYNKEDMKKVFTLAQTVDYDQKRRVKDANFTFRNAGHIPGSALVELDVDGKKIVYSGDIQLKDSLLQKKADPTSHPDVLILESTYGYRDQKNRQKEVKEFIKSIKATLDRGGSVIIPVFAVQRGQEIITTIYDKFKAPIYYDGLGIKVTKKFLEMGNFVRNLDKLKKALKTVIPIKNWQHRKDVIKEQGIFVTTSGMMTGGPVIEYMKHHYFEPRSAVYLTGYQVEGTNGRMLIDTGKINLDGMTVKVKCEVKKFEFSGHADATELKKLIKTMKPKNLVLVHGEHESGAALKEYAESLGIKTFLPGLGVPIEIR